MKMKDYKTDFCFKKFKKKNHYIDGEKNALRAMSSVPVQHGFSNVSDMNFYFSV